MVVRQPEAAPLQAVKRTTESVAAVVAGALAGARAAVVPPSVLVGAEAADSEVRVAAAQGVALPV